MASTLNMSNFANRDSLLGPETKPADAMSRTVGLDNGGLVGLQRQIMRGHLIWIVWKFKIYFEVLTLDFDLKCYSSRARWGPWEIGADCN